MNTDQLKGVWTALITPFKNDGSIDWQAYETLIDIQLKAQITGLVICGTTGESPTITDQESFDLIKKAKELVGNRCLIMAGSGTNNTAKSIEKTKLAKEAGADLIILVNPYYNKPTQNGLYLHFKAIAESTDLPVILYNIKGRTGVNLETPTLVKLAQDVKNIVGVKEASGDLGQIANVCSQKLDNFIVLSGDDNLTFQIMKDYGACGVISVASNIVPQEMVRMVNLTLDHQLIEAEEINTSLNNLYKNLFIETNPIPVKYAASLMGLCQNVYRLPMCPIEETHGQIVKDLLTDLKLI